MELKITIDDASIAKLADAIAARIGGTPAPVEAPVPTNTPNAVPAPAPVVEEAPAATSMTLGDLRGLAKGLVQAKGAPGRDTLVAILADHGAKNLTTLSESKFEDVAQAIRDAS